MDKFDQRINITNVLFFDMDGTLINTNYANYLSYKKAIHQVIHLDIDNSYNLNKRFNRKVLKKVAPNLTMEEYKNIIQLKNEFYIDYLPETRLNDLVADILKKYSKTNKTVLVTNSRKERAIATLNYHNLLNKFDYKYFRISTNNGKKNHKYSIALNSLQISSANVIVFENDNSEIKDIITTGILEKNIIKIDFNN